MIKKINIPEMLVLFFLITFFCAKTFFSLDLLINGMIAFAGIVCFVYAALKRKVLLWQWFVAFGLSMLIFVSAIYNGNASILEILWVWCYFGVAIMLKNFKIDSKKISYLLIAITLIYGTSILLGIEATDAIGTGSGNNISTYILFYAFLIYIKRYEEGKKVVYWPSIIAIALSIWGNGRAGLLSSLILFGLVFLYDYKFVSKEKNALLRKTCILAIGLLFVASLFLKSYIETFFIKLVKYGYSSVRSEIFLEYIVNSLKSIGNFMFGVPMISATTPLLTKYSANPHNAFLMLHAEFGIIGFSYVILMLSRFIIKNFKEKKYMYFIIFIVWFVRSMFDWTGFPGVFDILFFYFVLITYDKEDEKFKNILRRIYGNISMQIYKMISKTTITSTSKFFNTKKMTKYHHLVAALRYVAIEEYYGKNDYGMELYRKANKWESQKHLEKDLEKFNSLIKSIETKGYNMNSKIYMDLDENCFNGTHRLAVCAWFGIKEVPVVNVKRHLKTKSIDEMREYYNLSDEDYKRLERAYQSMRDKLKK